MSYYELPDNKKEEEKLVKEYVKKISKEKEKLKTEIQALRTLKLILHKRKDGKPYQRLNLAFNSSDISLNDRYLMNVDAHKYSNGINVAIRLQSKKDANENRYICVNMREKDEATVSKILERAEEQARNCEKQLEELESVSIQLIQKYVRQLAELKATIKEIDSGETSNARLIFSAILQ